MASSNNALCPVVRSHSKFFELPLSALAPGGWLKVYLEKQRAGLTGHIEVAGYPFNTRGWADPQIRPNKTALAKWWPYEQVAYWVDGAVRCAHLLRDPRLLRKVLPQIDHVLNHPDPDGYLGPPFLKSPPPGERMARFRWAHAVFFRAVIAHYSATRDPRVIPALTNHYLSDTSDHSEHRDVCNVEIMAWLYARTGDRRILDRAISAFEAYQKKWPNADTTIRNMSSSGRISEHGVTFNEIAKLGAILYPLTGRRKLLDAVVNAYRKIDSRHMLIDGVHSCYEFIAGRNPLETHETCDIADFTWSIGYLLMATGKAEYADKIERAIFNAAPGAVRFDFKALQYFSGPNQVIADAASNHIPHKGREGWMAFRPNPGTECCPGAVNRIMPNFVSRMWMSAGPNTVVAALYGPSQVSFRAGRAQVPVTIVERTDYPFSEHIDFEIIAARPVTFTLKLRIPGWCARARLLLNGRPVTARSPTPASFIDVRRRFRAGDRLRLELPMSLRFVRWPAGGVAFERGPLVFSLKIAEKWKIDKTDRRSTPEFPAWNLYPAGPWNFALAVDPRRLNKDVAVASRACPADPWSPQSAPIELRVPVRRVRGWLARRRTPDLPETKTMSARLSRRAEMASLVPYGCTHLRITLFPWQHPRKGESVAVPPFPPSR